ncbi:MAG: FMN-binding protein [Bacillota bacterium]
MKKLLTMFFILSFVMIFSIGAFAAETSWEDGEYVGLVEKDRGDEVIVVEIKRGSIVDLDILNQFKLNYDYDEGREAFLKYPHLVESKQSADIDVISGATGSITDYNKATKMALNIASGNYDGNKYYGVAENFENGHVVVEITVEDDKITDARLVTGDPESDTNMLMPPKGEDYGSEPALEYYKTFPDKVVENQGEVDMISGATHSYNSYNEALKMAMEQAGLMD